MNSRRGFAIQRLMNAMRQAHADCWFIVFDTLTLAYDRLEASYADPNTLPLHDALPICRLGDDLRVGVVQEGGDLRGLLAAEGDDDGEDRKSTRLNSSHGYISYVLFCFKKIQCDRLMPMVGLSFLTLSRWLTTD